MTPTSDWLTSFSVLIWRKCKSAPLLRSTPPLPSKSRSSSKLGWKINRTGREDGEEEKVENGGLKKATMSRHLVALLCHVDDNHCNFHDNVGDVPAGLIPFNLSVAYHSPVAVFDIHLHLQPHKRPTDYTNTSECSSRSPFLSTGDGVMSCLARMRLNIGQEGESAPPVIQTNWNWNWNGREPETQGLHPTNQRHCHPESQTIMDSSLGSTANTERRGKTETVVAF